MKALGAVLLVEDDDDIREDLAEVLADAGFAVIPARDGVDALERLADASGALCVVLLDVMMPRMDGPTLRERLRADARFGAVPVVLMSGAGNLRELQRQLDAAESLLKPFKLDALLATVERYCTPA